MHSGFDQFLVLVLPSFMINEHVTLLKIFHRYHEFCCWFQSRDPSWISHNGSIGSSSLGCTIGRTPTLGDIQRSKWRHMKCQNHWINFLIWLTLVWMLTDTRQCLVLEFLQYRNIRQYDLGIWRTYIGHCLLRWQLLLEDRYPMWIDDIG